MSIYIDWLIQGSQEFIHWCDGKDYTFTIYNLFVFFNSGECQWLHLELIKEVMSKVRAIFPSVHYAYTTIPTYPSGQIGFIIATLDTTIDVKKQSRSTEESLSSSSSLKYYSKQIHHASFILPSFADKELNPWYK